MKNQATRATEKKNETKLVAARVGNIRSLKMDQMAHQDHMHMPNQHPGHGPAQSAGAHDRHAGHSVAMFRDKFWLSFALTIPVVFLSSDVQRWFGYTVPSFPGSTLLAPILGTIIFFYGGLVFIRGAWNEIADHKPGMMTLISLGITVAFLTSLAGTFGLFKIEVWWELATLTTIMILGHWMEMRAVSQARGALNALAALLPDTAERVMGQETQTVPLSDVKVNDVVLVRPGTRVPADGSVIEGAADVDESMITGESRSVSKGVGAAVVAGTVASGGSLRVRVTAVGEQTALSGIMRLVAAAQASGSRTQAIADRAAAMLFYVAVAAGATTLAYWWFAGDRPHALTRTATVLIIACPHALGLAIPLVIAISTSLGAQNGLLVKDRLALERARDLDVVVFDKTGTLTRGAPVLSGVAVTPHIDEGEMLGLAAAVEADSEHPLAKAIVKGAARRGVKPAPAVGFDALPGLGARASVNGRSVAVGGPRLLVGTGATVPSELEHAVKTWSSEGRTVLYVLRDGVVIGSIAVEDEIRPESVEAVKALHDLGVRVAMITGDSQTVADSVAKTLGIDDVAAQVLPADKASAIKQFQSGAQKVAMVGDGVNDAPALAT